jgi:hypothetical protein
MRKYQEDEIGMSDKITVWVGVISSILTIVLSVMNFKLNEEMQQIDAYVKKVEADLKEKSFELEKSKESTSRYEFVNKLMPDLLTEEKEHVVLTTNLIALVLDESETEQLFKGFYNSKQESVRAAGQIGIETINTIQENKSKYQAAIEYEKSGFDSIISGDYTKAIEYFGLAEKVYPTFHQVYEIKKLLQNNVVKMDDERTKKAVLREIADNLSWKAPNQQLIKIKEMIE